MSLEDLGVCAQDLFQLVEPLLQLPAISRPEARLLALLILAQRAIPCTPAACRLPAIAFYLTTVLSAITSVIW